MANLICKLPKQYAYLGKDVEVFINQLSQQIIEASKEEIASDDEPVFSDEIE